MARNYIGRLNADGSIDGTFNPGASNPVYTLSLQTDGKILVGGMFSTLAGEACNRIGRLTPDGVLDFDFNGGTDDYVYSVAQQPDGKTLVGGIFSTLGGVSRQTVGRVSNPQAALQFFSVAEDGTKLEWLRSGSGPEFVHAAFELSTDGISFTPLGFGERITGGWELNGLSLPIGQNFFIRGRAYSISGLGSGSHSLYEAVWHIYLSPPPLYLYLPMILK